MYINVDTIQQSVNDEEIKYLAAFIFFKTKFSNSCYYSWSIKSISDKSGMSRTAVRKYVKWFVTQGWCKEINGNLLFKKTSALYQIGLKLKNHHAKLQINKGSEIRTILEELYLIVFKRNADQFEFTKKLWKDKQDNNVLNGNHYKKIRKHCIGRAIKQSEISGFQCSTGHISKLFNTSKSTASRIIKGLRERKRILRYRNYKGLGNVNENPVLIFWLKHVPGCFKDSTGYVTQIQSNSYKF